MIEKSEAVPLTEDHVQGLRFMATSELLSGATDWQKLSSAVKGGENASFAVFIEKYSRPRSCG